MFSQVKSHIYLKLEASTTSATAKRKLKNALNLAKALGPSQYSNYNYKHTKSLYKLLQYKLKLNLRNKMNLHMQNDKF